MNFVSVMFMCGEAARSANNGDVSAEKPRKVRGEAARSLQTSCLSRGEAAQMALGFDRNVCLPGQPWCNIANPHDPGIMPPRFR